MDKEAVQKVNTHASFMPCDASPKSVLGSLSGIEQLVVRVYF
jgi:hypothetical protein